MPAARSAWQYSYMVCLHSAWSAPLTKKHLWPQLWGDLRNPAGCRAEVRYKTPPTLHAKSEASLESPILQRLLYNFHGGKRRFAVSVGFCLLSLWVWIPAGWGVTLPCHARPTATAGCRRHSCTSRPQTPHLSKRDLGDAQALIHRMTELVEKLGKGH